MCEEPKGSDGESKENREAARRNVGLPDLVAFLAVLGLAGLLVVLLRDGGARLDVRVVFAAASALVLAGSVAWVRIRREAPRRWTGGQVLYQKRQVKGIIGWGVRGAPVVELPHAEPETSTVPAACPPQPPGPATSRNDEAPVRSDDLGR